MSSSSDLMNVKHEFTSLIQEVQPWILSHFVMWLDLKVAEFKVYGYMILDQTSESQHATINECPIRRADGKLISKQRVRSEPDVTIIPRSKINSSVNGVTQNTDSANRRNVGMVPLVTQTKEADNIQSNSERCSEKVNNIENIVTLHMGGINNNNNNNNNIASSNKASLTESFDKQRQNHSESGYLSNIQSNCNVRKKNLSESVQRGIHQSDCMNVSGAATSQDEIESCYTQNNLPLYKSLQFSRVISNNPRNRYKTIDDGLQNSDENECQDTSNETTNFQLCSEENSEIQSQQLDNVQRYQSVTSTDTNQNADIVDHVTSDLILDESTGTVVVKIEDDSDYEQFNCSMRVVSPDKNGHYRSFSSSSDQDLSNVASQQTNEDNMVYSGTSTVSDGTSLYLVCSNQEESTMSVGSPFKHSDGIPKNQFERTAYNHSSKWKKWIDPESGKYKCIQCNKLFVNRSSFYRHKRLHGEKRFHCFMCDKAFHRSEHLRIHIRRHGKIDSLCCHNCNKHCDNLQTYQDHVEQCVFITDNHMHDEQWSSTTENGY
ncbi:hypothetical protein KUTeg_015179 [Tegillarca granosa]|uniref:C2H2-type domain-containing protein n=1 Tax=Tegillarca granosa TaxID=220873 RepID=A0ABQ9EUL4_TEGGR|nr:hypothetical protein KUTeg_015179 [Tegillarca granosa]